MDVSGRPFPGMAQPFPAGNRLFNANSDGVGRSTGNRKHQRDGKARSDVGERPPVHLILPAALPCIPHPLLYPWFQGMLFICLPFWSHTNPVQSRSLPTTSSGQPFLAGSISACGKEEEAEPRVPPGVGCRDEAFTGPLGSPKADGHSAHRQKEQKAQKPCPKHARVWDAQVPWQPQQLLLPL